MGRVTIPEEIRRELNLKENDELLVVRLANSILLLRKADISKLVNSAIKDFEELKEKEIDRIKSEINKPTREKLKVFIDINIFISVAKSDIMKTMRSFLNSVLTTQLSLLGTQFFRRNAGGMRKFLESLVESCLKSLRAEWKLLSPIGEYSCMQTLYFRGEYADLYHAATCFKAKAVLITNDKDFETI